MKSLSIYIHIPFCIKKCFYCDFLSAPAQEDTKKKYVDRLLAEIESEAEKYKDYEVVSVFFGGGTPSVLKTEDTKRIMELLRQKFCLVEKAEITTEINPGTADDKKLQEYREMGFNRLSIGLQSAEEKELKVLGRIHDYRTFLAVYQSAVKAGFANINVDIMSALPGQSIESYQNTLEKVLELEPSHISAYSLIVEEGTPFFTWYAKEESKKGARPPLPSEETEREMYAMTEKRLLKQGYHRYEISNYAKTGYECIHNTAYWTRQDYVGFGIGAASLVSGVRFQNKRDLHSYLEGRYVKEEVTILTRKDAMEEFMFLGLRLVRGVSKQEFQQEFGKPFDTIYKKVLEKLKKQELIEEKEDRVFLTARGLDVSNYAMAEFLLDEQNTID